MDKIIKIISKIIKITVLSTLVLVVLIIGYLIYDSHWSSKAKKGRKNILNSRKVKIQMSQEDVLSIMGKPDTVIGRRFYYITNNDDYIYIEISFDSLKRVKKIYSPEK
ncbi:MAG: hypothetical protein KatS3mg027_2479 [Bacteroidia bacterium]|nr:MAG: hypothetical protein KatS3mg027_2479 [Bacteroidia bacterium]